MKKTIDVERELLIHKNGLLNDTLPFWLPRCLDREYGGYGIARDQDGTLIDTDKGIWVQGRFAWLLGELYNTVERRPEWLEGAQHGVGFLDKFGKDPVDGRMWFRVTREGAPIHKRRYSFSESFAAIAYGELYQASGDEHFKEKARAAFDQFVSHNLNPKGVQPKYTDTRPLKSIGFPMILMVTVQELRDSIGLADADRMIDDCVETIRNDHMKPELSCVMETVGVNGEVYADHFDGRMLNPGHALEAAWFILMEGKRRGDDALIKTGSTILDWMWERGWDKEFGGMLYFVDLNNLPIQEYYHDMKFWWPQNETIIATLLAYQLTGDQKYADWYNLAHQWALDHFRDEAHGEWFGYLHRDGSVASRLKGSLWKGPFHLPRMQLRCWQILEEMKLGLRSSITAV